MEIIPPTPRRIRQGFTLIELLVVISVIAVLIALLLPAIQQVRETSRRTTCKNNLHQVGIALQAYHSHFQVFPSARIAPGMVRMGGPTQGGGAFFLNASGWTSLLPFLDQAPLFNAYDPNQAASWAITSAGGAYTRARMKGDPNVNANVVKTLLPVLVCPSDPGPRYYPTPSPLYSISATQAGGAKTSYDFSVSNLETTWANSYNAQSKTRRPLFGSNTSTRMDLILDGSSNTVAMCEQTFDRYNGVTGAWGYSCTLNVGIDLAWCGINRWDYNGCCAKYGRLGQATTPGSLHVGGCHVLLADGAVRFLNQNTSALTRNLLFYIADGQLLDDF